MEPRRRVPRRRNPSPPSYRDTPFWRAYDRTAQAIDHFGTSHPGAIVLHNFPRFLQEFRRLLHLRPAASFEALTDNPIWAEEVQSNSMVDVLLSHYPELRHSLRGAANAFQPWRAAEPTATPTYPCRETVYRC